MELTCTSCGNRFYMTEGDVRYFQMRDMPLPRTCPLCRQRSGSGSPVSSETPPPRAAMGREERPAQGTAAFSAADAPPLWRHLPPSKQQRYLGTFVYLEPEQLPQLDTHTLALVLQWMLAENGIETQSVTPAGAHLDLTLWNTVRGQMEFARFFPRMEASRPVRLEELLAGIAAPPGQAAYALVRLWTLGSFSSTQRDAAQRLSRPLDLADGRYLAARLRATQQRYWRAARETDERRWIETAEPVGSLTLGAPHADSTHSAPPASDSFLTALARNLSEFVDTALRSILGTSVFGSDDEPETGIWW